MTFGGRRAIVTGAAQGLGRAVAERLLKEGASVTMVDVDGEKVAAAALAIDRPKTTLAIAADLTDTSAAERTVANAVSAFGGLDILVNAAGGSGFVFADRIESVDDAVWHDILASNLQTAFATCRAAMPHLRKSAHGRIINFSSDAMRGAPAIRTPMASKLPYVTAKGAIVSLSFQLALDLGASGGVVNALFPGFVLNELGTRNNTLFNEMTDDERAAMLHSMPAHRRTPGEVGWAVAFLASDAAAEFSGYAVGLKGPIDGMDLRIVDAVETPLGRYARLEGPTTAS